MTESEKTSKQPKAEETKAEAPDATPAAAAPVKKKDSSKTIFIVVGVVVLVFVVLPIIFFTVVAGIIGHKVAENVQVSGDGKSATIKTKNGDEITTGGASQTLPKDWPTSVTTYNGTIINATRLTIEGKVTYSAVIETKDDPATVAAALSKSFSTNGWTTSLDNKTSDGGLISAENGTYHVQILYTVKDGKTSISYTVVPMAAQ